MSKDQRLFIALVLPKHLQDEIQSIIQQLQENIDNAKDVRWVAPENLHLTLKFLGNTHPNQIQAIKDALTQIANRHFAFRLRLNKLGAFPKLNKASVLWLGLEGQENELQGLQQDVAIAMTDIGFAAEEKDFHPHLSIGRVKRHVHDVETRQQIGQALRNCPAKVAAEWHCQKVFLMKSDLRPQGAQYTSLFEVNLAKKDHT